MELAIVGKIRSRLSEGVNPDGIDWAIACGDVTLNPGLADWDLGEGDGAGEWVA